MKEIINENNYIVINQIHYCRFLHYFYLNLDYVLLEKKVKEKLILFVFKCLLKIVKQLVGLSQ
jgi:hypothetical protein